MGTINLGNSLRYDMTGRKRKTKSLKTKKKCHTMSYKPLETPQHVLDRMKEAEEHRKKYPSMSSQKYSPQTDNGWKLEESKKFTVAPAYNKGAYQVIPKEDIEWIGK
tara:strand:- start:225 stop:545 length:321 start_codon:yes stop_codon:yes gene_type:complete